MLFTGVHPNVDVVCNIIRSPNENYYAGSEVFVVGEVTNSIPKLLAFVIFTLSSEQKSFKLIHSLLNHYPKKARILKPKQFLSS